MKALNTREWIFLTIIIAMIQFIIHWLSMSYAGSTKALGYTSFAGTIISIILAVLAIIYSFLQNSSQNNLSQTLQKHAETISGLTEKLEISEAQITSSLSQLKHASERIEKSIEIQTDTNFKIAEIATKSAEKSEEKQEKRDVRTESPRQPKEENNIYESRFMDPTINGLLIHLTCKHKISTSEALSKIIRPWIEKTIEKDEDFPKEFRARCTRYSATWMLLSSLGIVNHTRKNGKTYLTSNEEFNKQSEIELSEWHLYDGKHQEMIKELRNIDLSITEESNE
ncbi:hypothetical protein [Pseudomonas oryzihabitans]|uniref:hypothetical protein n=1 Tax=Pseudomonas oryzihabitans TaxID=47885 RepID=UPI000A54038E|nr:hypothetical protein [Pseudomonas psychrotolerans]